MEGARAFAKKTRGVIQSDEVIDLTADQPPTEFVMIVDLPRRKLEEDEDGGDRGGSENEDEEEDMTEGE